MSGAAGRRGRGGRGGSGAGRGRGGGPNFSSPVSLPPTGGGQRIPAGGFDGPGSAPTGSGNELPARSRGGSNAPSTSGTPNPPQTMPQPHSGPASQPGSRRPSTSGPVLQAPSAEQRYDPALESAPRLTDKLMLKNIDLPASSYNIDKQFALDTEFKRRPGFNDTGRQITLQANAYPVTQFPNKQVFQYDVIIGNGAEKKAVSTKVWSSNARKTATGPQIIYDGNKLAWSVKDHNEIRLMVDLDVEEGKPSRGDRNQFRLRIVKTKVLDLELLRQFLAGRVQMSVPVLEAISFMDHLLREGPANNPQLIGFKRSFFSRGGQKADLGGNVEVIRGVYQSMKLAEGQKLIINLDVSNSTFWKRSLLTTAITQLFKIRDIPSMYSMFKLDASAPNQFHKRLNGVFKGTTVKVNYKGNPLPNKEWKMARVGMKTASTEMLDWKDPQTNQPTGERVSIAQYFLRKYNVRLQHTALPLVEMTRKGVKFPMEFLEIPEHQRYTQKLDEVQTANMIRFAVSPPATRLQSINEGKALLNWAGDKFHEAYGLRVDPNTLKTQARLLPAPAVMFGRNVKEQPGTRGRWDLRGKVFHTANPNELVSWGIGLFQGRTKLGKEDIDKFWQDFARAYRTHGGKIGNKPPATMMLTDDPKAAVAQLWNKTGDLFQRAPQILIFLVQDKSAFRYLAIKKECDCKFGIVSQVLQAAQVQRGQAQYYSNVLMKFNAKLGGSTSQVIPHPTSGFKQLKNNTMFIGADVSHAAPGSQAASMAAITISFDAHAARYAAACQTNGQRVEMITDKNVSSMMGPLVVKWINTVGKGQPPSQVYYMRDGVSEGQFAHVMQQEVKAIRAVLAKASGGVWKGNMTVVIASKRHHVRAFPKSDDRVAGDNKGNPVPGCLIERDVTMPNEFDFYLYSHIALQGTSRPVHYTILHDDANHKPSEVQNMIYEHCYQYMRSTTSVSLHPAVYYAHLASNRAKAHDNTDENATVASVEKSEVEPLMPMTASRGIDTSMWYI